MQCESTLWSSARRQRSEQGCATSLAHSVRNRTLSTRYPAVPDAAQIMQIAQALPPGGRKGCPTARYRAGISNPKIVSATALSQRCYEVILQVSFGQASSQVRTGIEEKDNEPVGDCFIHLCGPASITRARDRKVEKSRRVKNQRRHMMQPSVGSDVKRKKQAHPWVSS